ncbi:MAG: hypothetical protein H8K05_11055 [Nitrospira sp.]|nr:hypothetical protein [Nitrospira sp.]MCS6318287.1 hypothetical protein [Nitrospira sp.]
MMRVTKPSIGLAAALAGLYLILAAFSVACAFDHADPTPAGHHHGETVSHSSFCAWACQANPTSDIGPSALVLQPFLMVAFFVGTTHTVIVSRASFHAASRAPPVQS